MTQWLCHVNDEGNNVILHLALLYILIVFAMITLVLTLVTFAVYIFVSIIGSVILCSENVTTIITQKHKHKVPTAKYVKRT